MTTTKKKLTPFTVDLPTRRVTIAPAKDGKHDADEDGNVWRIDLSYTMRDGNQASAVLRFATKTDRDTMFRRMADLSDREKAEVADHFTRKAVEMEDWINKTTGRA